MPFPVAQATDLCSTPATFSKLAASSSSAAGINRNLTGFDPLSAAPNRAVYPVFSRVFLIFLIPLNFKLHVKKFLDMLEGYMVSCTTPGGHMLRVC